MQVSTGRVIAGFLLFALAACGGGGGGSVTTPATRSPGGGGSPQTMSIPFSIKIPPKAAPSSLRRKPFDLSPSTASIAVFVYPQGGTQSSTPTATFNVGAGATGCTQNSDGSFTCSFSVTGPIGSDSITLIAYIGANGSGTVCSQVTINVSASSGMSPVSITTNAAIVAQIRLSLGTSALTEGTAGTSIITVNAYDPGGNVILAPGTFASPVTISTDSSAVSLSATSANAPGTQITASYSGASAPYAVHIAGAASGVQANMIVGATLNIVPAMSFAMLGLPAGEPVIATYASTTQNEPPQLFLPLSPLLPGAGNFTGFAALPNGNFVVANYGSGCTLSVMNSTSIVAQQTLPNTSYQCPIAATATGHVLLLDNGASSPQIDELAVSGTAFTSVRTIPLTSSALQLVSSIATDSAGDIATLTGTYSSPEIAVYPSGSTTPTTFSLPSSTTVGWSKVAYTPGGSIAVAGGPSSGSQSGEIKYQLNTYSLSGTLSSSATVSFPFTINDNYVQVTGIAFDSAGNSVVGVGGEYNAGSSSSWTQLTELDLLPSNATGNSTPTTISLSGAGRMNYAVAGPISIPGPVVTGSSSASISGDMMGYQASRTWTYHVTPGNTNYPPYYVGLYADPQLVNGNEQLVAYLAAAGSSDPFTGTKVGSLDLLATQGGYQAEAFSSVSSGTSGTSGPVPGAPLLVPNTLVTNQTWNPLANASYASLVGVSATAQVLSTGTVSASMCPGSPTQSATVQYTLTIPGQWDPTSAISVTYVPGCGIVRTVSDDGSVMQLTTVGSLSSLGQQDVPRGQPPIVSALHALWQHTFVKPH